MYYSSEQIYCDGESSLHVVSVQHFTALVVWTQIQTVYKKRLFFWWSR
jgi:hypothetical protein